MQGLENLPPWLQIILSIAMFAVTAWVYFSGAFKRLPPPPSKDVVVPSLSIADSQQIQNWIDSLRENTRLEREQAEASRKTVWLLEEINGRLARMEHDLDHIADRSRTGSS